MAPNKTIYVREADREVWEKAEKLAGGSVSGLIADALRRYVEEEGMKRSMTTEVIKPIEVRLGGHERPLRTVRFVGEWLVWPDEDASRTTEPGYDAGAYYGVALTENGNIAVYCAHVNGGFDTTLEVYSSIEAAEGAGVPPDIMGAAASKLGPNYVQERDI